MQGIEPIALSSATDRCGNALDLNDEQRELTSAVKAGSLIAAPPAPNIVDGDTEVIVTSLIQWLRMNRWEELADELSPTDTLRPSPATEATASMANNQCAVQGKGEVTADNIDIPGKLPRVSVCKLAIEAAWQFECTSNRPATASEVMTQLQTWADAGAKPAVLRQSMKEKHAASGAPRTVRRRCMTPRRVESRLPLGGRPAPSRSLAGI